MIWKMIVGLVSLLLNLFSNLNFLNSLLTSASFDIVCKYCPDEFGACLVWKGGDATPRMPRTMFTSSVKVIFCVLFAASCGFHRSPGSKIMERRARKGMTCMQPTTKNMNVKKLRVDFTYMFLEQNHRTHLNISHPTIAAIYPPIPSPDPPRPGPTSRPRRPR